MLERSRYGLKRFVALPLGGGPLTLLAITALARSHEVVEGSQAVFAPRLDMVDLSRRSRAVVTCIAIPVHHGRRKPRRGIPRERCEQRAAGEVDPHSHRLAPAPAEPKRQLPIPSACGWSAQECQRSLAYLDPAGVAERA
jgi:hypothetical protein